MRKNFRSGIRKDNQHYPSGVYDHDLILRLHDGRKGWAGSGTRFKPLVSHEINFTTDAEGRIEE